MIRYDKYAVSDALKEIRNINRLTQASMAEVLGVSNSHYAQIEQGTHGLSLELLMKISVEFDTDINKILGVCSKQIDRRVLDLSSQLEKLNSDEQEYCFLIWAQMVEGLLARKGQVA